MFSSFDLARKTLSPAPNKLSSAALRVFATLLLAPMAAACGGAPVADDKPPQAKPADAAKDAPADKPPTAPAAETPPPVDAPKDAPAGDAKPAEVKPDPAAPADAVSPTDGKAAAKDGAVVADIRAPDVKFSTSAGETMLAEGIGLLHENNLHDAQQRLLNATKQDPKSATSWYNLAICQFRMGQEDDAIASAKQAVGLNDTFTRAVVLLSTLHLRKHEHALALQVVTEALAKRSDDVMLLGAKARAQVAVGDHEAAVKTCIEALRHDQSNPEVMRYLAEAYLGLGRDGLAKLALTRAYSVYIDEAEKAKDAPADVVVKKQYEVRIAQGGGSWRGTGAEALSRESGLAHIFYLYGRFSMRDEDWESAREHFKKAVGYRADYAEAWNNLGICWIVARKGEEAVEAVNKALENEPKFLEARINLGSAWRVSKDPDRANKAKVAYDSAMAQDPKRAEIQFNLALLYLENKTADMATDEARFQKSIEYFSAYKEMRGAALEGKELEAFKKYLSDAELFLKQEQTKRVNAEKATKEADEDKIKKDADKKLKEAEDAKKKAEEEEAARKKAEEEAAKKPPEPAPTPSPSPAPEGGTPPAPPPEGGTPPAPPPEGGAPPTPPPEGGAAPAPSPSPPADGGTPPAADPPKPEDGEKKEDKKEEPPPPPASPPGDGGTKPEEPPPPPPPP
ncbi:MAG: tetratricopeptide repeat protein [Myxococcales bacterium]|nr:tetratricopeptide repeat protein [Myxococcales bacterium]